MTTIIMIRQMEVVDRVKIILMAHKPLIIRMEVQPMGEVPQLIQMVSNHHQVEDFRVISHQLRTAMNRSNLQTHRAMNKIKNHKTTITEAIILKTRKTTRKIRMKIKTKIRTVNNITKTKTWTIPNNKNIKTQILLVNRKINNKINIAIIMMEIRLRIHILKITVVVKAKANHQ